MQKSRWASSVVATMAAGVLIGTPMAAAPAFAAECANPVPVNVLSITDFHGRIHASSPDTSVYFATLEENRDDNTVVVANGDSIGATLFPSFIQDDLPTIQILNALELDASSIGNHELDRGFADFTGRVRDAATYPYVGVGLTANDGSNVADATHTVVTTPSGVRVAIVGATTDQLPSLIGPEFFTLASQTAAIAAINAEAAAIKSGDLADIVIAAFHEGAGANGSISSDVDMIINGHTHAETASIDANGRPSIQPKAQGGAIGKTQLLVDVDDNKVCSVVSNAAVVPAKPADAAARDALIAAYPRAAAIDSIVKSALSEASVLGSEVLTSSTADISRGLTAAGALDNRAVESTMSNMVAEMFADVLGGTDPNFIGVQNPGGTRGDFNPGNVTYAEAAAVLPFANTLMTTQLTGAQVKVMLEQQWQQVPPGANPPSRPYLALGLSSNVSYTYDESRALNDRITGVYVNGAPIDPAATYTVGSGNFLITGGDNFHVIAQGQNPTDTGRADLEAWVAWLRTKTTIDPDYTRRGVSVTGSTELVQNRAEVWTVGQPLAGGLNTQTIDINSTGVPAATTLTAHLGSQTGATVGSASVINGTAFVSVKLPSDTAAGPATIYLVADTGTVAIVPVNYSALTFSDVPAESDFAPAIQWMIDSGITTGYNATTFGYGDGLLQEQVAMFLWRHAGMPVAIDQTACDAFTDVPADSMFRDAICWVAEQGINTGADATTFGYGDPVLREQVVGYLYRSNGSPTVVDRTACSAFADVPADSEYADAICWAADLGITRGYNATTFGYGDPVLREQMAAFLYRSVS